MSLPYVLVFRGRHEPVGWTGSWPPPRRMWVLTGRRTGQVAYADPDTTNTAVQELLQQAEAMAVVERYVRRRYSELPDSMGDRVARGAEYVPEAEP